MNRLENRLIALENKAGTGVKPVAVLCVFHGEDEEAKRQEYLLEHGGIEDDYYWLTVSFVKPEHGEVAYE